MKRKIEDYINQKVAIECKTEKESQEQNLKLIQNY